MYGQFVAAVFRRAFRPVKGAAEWATLLVAVMAPTLARFAGINVPASDNLLAYIGAAVLAFVVMRISFVAPY